MKIAFIFFDLFKLGIIEKRGMVGNAKKLFGN